MAVVRPYGFKIDFVRNPTSGSAAWFFLIMLKFIFTPILEIKIYGKKFLNTQKISFAKLDFHKTTFFVLYIWICSLHLNKNNFRIIWDTEIWTMSPPVLQLIFSLFLNRCHLVSVLTLNFRSRFCNLFRLYKIYSFFHYFLTIEEQKLLKISISPSRWAVL